MKAEGGWGTVCTEYCSIHPESDEYPWTSARLWDEGDVINLSYLCEMAHEHGALVGVQLWYSGIHAINMESREVPRGATQLSSNVWSSRTAPRSSPIAKKLVARALNCAPNTNTAWSLT